MLLSNVCNRLTSRAPCEPLDSRITLTPGFHPGCRLPRPLAWPRPCERCDRVELRLTAGFQLRRGLSMSLGFPMGQAPLGPVAFDRRPSDGRSLPVAFSARGKVAYQPLTLSVALSFERVRPGLHHRLVKGQRLHRTRAPSVRRRAFHPLSRGGEEHRTATSAIRTIHEHDRDR